MKTTTFTADAADLRRAAGIAAKATHQRNTIPILGCLRVSARRSGEVAFEGTDLDVLAEATCPADIPGKAFTFATRAGFVRDALTGATGPVSFDLSGDVLTITDGSGFEARARNLLSHEDFPDGSFSRFGQEADAGGTLSEDKLRRALASVAPCISTEKARYYLNGVYLHAVDGKLCAVATDGHRMARYQSDEDWPHAPGILPRSVVGDLLTLLRPGGNREVHIRSILFGDRGKNNDAAGLMQFRSGDWTISAKMIDGTYPAYAKVIPAADRPEAISVALTYEAVRRMRLGRGDYPAVSIDPDAGRMTARGADRDYSMSAPISGHGPSFGLNLNYLRAFARNAGTIRLSGVDGREPFLVLTEDPALTQVLMPVWDR